MDKQFNRYTKVLNISQIQKNDKYTFINLIDMYELTC